LVLEDGYEWRSDVREVTNGGTGQFLLAKGDGRKGSWVRPPRGGPFLRSFAGLPHGQPTDKTDQLRRYADFASKRGLLGEPVRVQAYESHIEVGEDGTPSLKRLTYGTQVLAEPSDLWNKEVARVSDLLAVIHDAKLLAAGDRAAYARTWRRFTWMQWVQPLLVFRYADPGTGALESYAIPELQAKEYGADLLHPDPVDLTALVRDLVRVLIERRVLKPHVSGQGEAVAHFRFTFGPAARPSLAPATLLGAIYLQLAEELLDRTVLAECLECGAPMDRKNRNKVRCSNACRKAASVRNKRAAVITGDPPS
jgi:hypothetical protein